MSSCLAVTHRLGYGWWMPVAAGDMDAVREDRVIKLKGIGHVNLRVADQEASKRFYRDILGFAIA